MWYRVAARIRLTSTTRAFEADLGCILDYCTRRASTAARVLNGWAALVTLACALLAALVEDGEGGLDVAVRCGPPLLETLREQVAKHCKEADAQRLQWTLSCTQSLVQ